MNMHGIHPAQAERIRARGGSGAPWVRPRALAMLNMDSAGTDELATLVDGVARGDRAAFAALFRAIAPRVKGFLLRSGAGPHAAEDLTQETLVLVWRKAATYDHARASVATWVFTIARNLWIDQVRRASNPAHAAPQPGWLHDLPELAAADDASGPLQGEQSRERLQAALATLPPEQAESVRMAYFGEATHAQVAAQLGIPLGTVKSRIRLALAALRRRLDGSEP
jgi:RNA polymerase sigma factor (sigma-70 family)